MIYRVHFHPLTRSTNVQLLLKKKQIVVFLLVQIKQMIYSLKREVSRCVSDKDNKRVMSIDFLGKDHERPRSFIYSLFFFFFSEKENFEQMSVEFNQSFT